jgi:methyl-accepting chemotaxis protein
MDGIRAKIQEMSANETSLLATRAATAAAAASTAQLATYAGGGAMLLVAGLGMILLNGGLIRPITGINATMATLAGGETNVVVPGIGRKDEIGEMANAVEVFRANAVANRKLELDAANQRNLTDEERQRNQAVERAKAEAMTQATSGLGDGLRQLAAGNLSFQLTEPFAVDFETLRTDFNASLTQLAQTMAAVAGDRLDR